MGWVRIKESSGQFPQSLPLPFLPLKVVAAASAASAASAGSGSFGIGMNEESSLARCQLGALGPMFLLAAVVLNFSEGSSDRRMVRHAAAAILTTARRGKWANNAIYCELRVQGCCAISRAGEHRGAFLSRLHLLFFIANDVAVKCIYLGAARALPLRLVAPRQSPPFRLPLVLGAAARRCLHHRRKSERRARLLSKGRKARQAGEKEEHCRPPPPPPVIMPAQCLGSGGGRGRRRDGGEPNRWPDRRSAAGRPVGAPGQRFARRGRRRRRRRAANHGAKSSSRVYLVTIIVLFSVPPRERELLFCDP